MVRIFSAASTDSTRTLSKLPSEEVGTAFVADTFWGGVRLAALGSLADTFSTPVLYARSPARLNRRGPLVRSEGIIVGVFGVLNARLTVRSEGAHGQLRGLAWRYPIRKISRLRIPRISKSNTAPSTTRNFSSEINAIVIFDCQTTHRTAQNTAIMAAPEKAMSSRLLTMKV
jgi:hypothetical protein